MQLPGYNKSISLRAALSFVILGTFAVLSAAGCGGGGGGTGGGPSGGSSVTVSGAVLSASSDTPPASAATVVIGGTTLTSNPATGAFSGSVGSNAATATVSAPGEVSRTITIKLVANQVNNLGNIFLADTGSDYSASVNGVVVTTVKGATQPVGGATVNIGNVVGVSATDGTFTLNGLPVGLGSVNGLYGTITASGFAVKLITADVLQFALVSGSNNLGNLLLAPQAGSTPIPPFTITGVIDVAGKPGAGVTVAIGLAGSATGVGQTQTDTNGKYLLWVAPATYTVTATDSSGTVESQNVTLKNLTTPVTVTTLNLMPLREGWGVGSRDTAHRMKCAPTIVRRVPADREAFASVWKRAL